MGTQTVGHVLIDIEDQRRQLYHRLEVNGVTVLVDGTPEDDPAIRQTIDLVLAAPDMRAALGKCHAHLFACADRDGALCQEVEAALAKAGE